MRHRLSGEIDQPRIRLRIALPINSMAECIDLTDDVEAGCEDWVTNNNAESSNRRKRHHAADDDDPDASVNANKDDEDEDEDEGEGEGQDETEDEAEDETEDEDEDEDEDEGEAEDEDDDEDEDKDCEGTKKRPRTNVILWGVDPGSVNCGLCKLNATSGEVLDLRRVEFRQSQKMAGNGHRRAADTDLGNGRLMDSVSHYILVTAVKDFTNTLVPIEVQPPTSDREIVSVQHTFQALMGSDKCLPVSPHAVKAHFSEYFPAKPGAKRNSPEQYRYDKRNAIINGRRFVPRRVREKYERENPDKKDDAYDAYWIARFAAERMINPHTGQRAPSGPRKRARGAANKRPRSRSVPSKRSTPAAIVIHKRLRVTLK